VTSQGNSPDDTIARTRLPVRAIVCAGGRETEYLRIGGGRPILLVTHDDQLAPGLEALARRLAAHGRVIVPLAPAPPSADARAAWLADFLDGVGLTSPRLVVAGGSADAAADSARAIGVAAHDLMWVATAQLDDAIAILDFVSAA
jgi:hypothetical protein